MKTFAIIGTGGMGRETMILAARHILKEIGGDANLVFAVEHGHPTDPINGYQVKTLESLLESSNSQLYYSIAIADSKTRERIANACENQKAVPFDVVAEESLVYKGSSYGPGAILAPFSMISANSKVGRFLHLNYYACITHDCTVGDFVTFGPKAQCNGNVIIENGAFIGAGAQIIQGSRVAPLIIGENAIIGMGAVVLDDVAPNSTVVGNPARVVRM